MRVWVENDAAIVRMFVTRGYESVSDPHEADILCFSGGSDVDPMFYGDVDHPETCSNAQRDVFCQSIWFDAYRDQLKVGICRGSQFLNVMNGGKLWQDVDNHAIRGTHPVAYLDEDCKVEYVGCTSTHHQMMMIPATASPAEVWGWTKRTTFRDTGADRRKPSDFDNDGPDIEIAFYPDTRTLCFQPHPEYGFDPCEDLFFRCLIRAIAR